MFKKDRGKSKKDQIQAKSKAWKKAKQIKENGDIDQEENKIVEQILKGVNILMLKSKDELRGSGLPGARTSELRDLLEEEMNTLFRLTHHNVFRI